MTAAVMASASTDALTATVTERAERARFPHLAIPFCSLVDQVPVTVLANGNSPQSDWEFHGVVGRHADEHPDTFAGRWFDNTAYGTHVIAFTDDPEPHRAAIAASSPRHDDPTGITPQPPITDGRPIGERDIAWEVVRVDRREAELRSVAADYSQNADLRALGLRSTSIYLPRQVIGLGVADATPDLVDQLAQIVDPDLTCLDGGFADPNVRVYEPGDTIEVLPAPTRPRSTLVTCGSRPFPLGGLLAPLRLGGGVRPDLEFALTADETRFQAPWGPTTGASLLIAEVDGTALIATQAALGIVVRSFERGPYGWYATGSSGGCTPRVALPAGLGATDIGRVESDPSSRTLRVEVNERSCASGRAMGDRLLGPQVVETADEVVLAFAVIPLNGDQTCPSNPSTTVTITLDAPFGNRAVRDGLDLDLSIADLFST